jgi:hypothetical protein
MLSDFRNATSLLLELALPYDSKIVKKKKKATTWLP